MLSVEGQPKRGLDNSPSVRRLVKENIEQMVWNYSLSQVFENSKTVVVEGTAPKELVRATLISHSIYYKLNPEIMDKVMDAFLSTC